MSRIEILIDVALQSSGDLSSNEMDYTLNPEAREFVPVSPTRDDDDDSRSQSPDICSYPMKNTEKLLKEEFIASSPLKGQEKNMDDVIVPSLDDFEKEIKKRPSNIIPKFDADEFTSNNVANHECECKFCGIRVDRFFDVLICARELPSV